jgi:hypothetical protein
MQVEDPFGTRVVELRSRASGAEAITALHARGWVELELTSLPLVGGRYTLSISGGRGRESAVHLEHVVEFHVWPMDVYGFVVPVEQPHGLVVVPHRWAHRAD